MPEAGERVIQRAAGGDYARWPRHRRSYSPARHTQGKYDLGDEHYKGPETHRARPVDGFHQERAIRADDAGLLNSGPGSPCEVAGVPHSVPCSCGMLPTGCPPPTLISTLDGGRSSVLLRDWDLRKRHALGRIEHSETEENRLHFVSPIDVGTLRPS